MLTGIISKNHIMTVLVRDPNTISFTVPISSHVPIQLIFHFATQIVSQHIISGLYMALIMLYQPRSYYCETTKLMLQLTEQSIQDKILLSTISTDHHDFSSSSSQYQIIHSKLLTFLIKHYQFPVFLFSFCRLIMFQKENDIQSL